MVAKPIKNPWPPNSPPASELVQPRQNAPNKMDMEKSVADEPPCSVRLGTGAVLGPESASCDSLGFAMASCFFRPTNISRQDGEGS